MEDLPLELLSQIEREADVRWPVVLVAPASTALSALTVYKVACQHLGCEPEALTARTILEGGIFVEVEDDLPTMFEDGIPKAEDGTTTAGSSGASPDGDGPPTSPDAKPSVT